jgi:hopene-associated glycosyltransferase HpnB
MEDMLLCLSLLSFAIWIYLLGFHGGFWRSGLALPRRAASGRARVVAIVPARDEAESIGQCIGSLLAQKYAGELAVILVDDNSTDGTGEIAASLDGGDRLTILRGASLEPGWSGKLWAVHQGLAQKKVGEADYILLTDADIEHAPEHVSMLVAKAEAERLDLVSEMVRLHCATWAERALIPAFVFFFQMLYPFRWAADPKKELAGAAGGTMLIRRAALDHIEGVSRIRGRLIDDCALAQQIKNSGGRIWLGHADDTVSLRVYADWREIWAMIARTAYEQLNRSPLRLLGCILGMGVVYCAPPMLALMSQGWPRVLGLAAWLLMAAGFQPTLRRYRRSPLWGLALPVIALFYLAATVASALRYAAGCGGGWKNRVYPESPSA